MSAELRSPEHWHDLQLSERHRRWGRDCPASDLDFIEYDRGNPVALVEYKHRKAQWSSADASIRALCTVAERAGLPCLLASYSHTPTWTFRVHPLNSHGLLKLAEWAAEADASWSGRGEPCVQLSELQWVRLLYWLRDRTLPESVAATMAEAG